MVRVLAVNNYPSDERFDRLRKCLELNGASVTAVGWNGCSPSEFGRFDGVALSGSPDMLSEERARLKYAEEMESIRGTATPLLGVCFGLQLIATAFGSEVVKDARPVLDFVSTDLIVDDPLFAGIPKPASLLESRHEVVKSVPSGFRLIARSETSPIAGVRHEKLPIYGVQSHPERYSSQHPDGNLLVGNFVRMLA